jgi:hypothetical protein
LIFLLPAIFPNVEAILYAAPLSDLVAAVVTAALSISFIKSLKRCEAQQEK